MLQQCDKQLINDDVSLFNKAASELATQTGARPEGSLHDELLCVLPIVQAVVRHNLPYVSKQAYEDVTNVVLLNLWNWRLKRIERHFYDDEWKKIASKAARNGVRMFIRQNLNKFVPFTKKTDENNAQFEIRDEREAIEGNTRIEVKSLARYLWREVVKCSPRQRYSLLLQKSDVILLLVSCNCCHLGEIADVLFLTKAELLGWLQRMPLTDEQIGEILASKINQKCSAKQIWEARSKARQRIYKVLTGSD